MKLVVLILLIFSLASCATSSPTESLSSPAASTESQIRVSKEQVPADAALSGRHFFVDKSLARAGLSAGAILKLEEQTRAHLKSLGYEEVSARRKAHLVIYLYAEKGMPADDGTPSAQMIFQTQIHMNRYGQRPKRIGNVLLYPPTEQWTGYEEELIAIYPDVLKDLMPKAPAENEKMKGDPGCILRFGFDETDGHVTKVPKGSPADKAGLKVGDVLESIDSVPYTLKQVPKLEESYASGLAVPIKLKRGEKTIRSTITPRIICE